MLTSVACVWVLLGTQSMASQRTAIVAQNFVAMCVGLGIAFSSDWRLSLVVLGVGPVLVLAGDLQMRAFTGQTQKVQKSLEKAGHVVEESVHGIRTVASFDLAEEMCQRCVTLCMLPGRVLLTCVWCVCCYGCVAVCVAMAVWRVWLCGVCVCVQLPRATRRASEARNQGRSHLWLRVRVFAVCHVWRVRGHCMNVSACHHPWACLTHGIACITDTASRTHNVVLQCCVTFVLMPSCDRDLQVLCRWSVD